MDTTALAPSPALTSDPVSQDTMSLEEIAKRLGISYSTAYELAVRNKLPVPVIRAGRQYRFSRLAFDRLMGAQHADVPISGA